MTILKKALLTFTLTFLPYHSIFAACSIISPNEDHREDAITILLSTNNDCPKDVFAFRKQIKAAGLNITTTMVANRGYHNPSEGSFSFFEMVTGKFNSITIEPGDFFFGHFTTVNENNEITADQGRTPRPRLMIEAFAWDATKALFNFYELIGDGNHNQWFYRGDSSDIYADNTSLHLQPDPLHPQFGTRLRCSGCHGAGGPIMKEIYAPHNDWWEPNRKLDFGGRKFNKSIVEIVEHLVSPDRLANSVISGIKKLQGSKDERNTLSFQEQLRPLFCPVEINFMSDQAPNENNRDINIPLEFFINKKLIDNQIERIVIHREAYNEALKTTGSHFPETSDSDADHAWLTPVKAFSDQIAIDHLINTGLIDEKFAYDVLSIEMTNPAFSSARCGLLKYIPRTRTSHWQAEFIQQLKTSNQPAAKELLAHLANPTHTPQYHQQIAKTFLLQCHEKLKSSDNVTKLFLLLTQRRAELKASEISKNRLGQILEPGFRVIFPETDTKPVPEKWRLTDSCEIKESNDNI